MRAGGRRGERDVHAVVDDHGHRQGGDERTGERQDFSRRRVLPADLDDRGTRPTSDGFCTDGDRIPPGEQHRIGDHHQAQLIGESHDQDPAWPARRDHRGHEFE